MKPIVFVRSTLALTCAAVLLGGCSWFHHKDRDNYYSKAQETKALEVPPDLDTPVTSNELTVPAAGAPGASASAAAASTAASSASTPPQMSPGGDSLHVADSVGHAWTRVGLALERAQVGTISERNETAHSYTLDVEGLKAPTPAPAEHHWYSRIMHPFGGDGSSTSTTVSGHLTVTVTADGDGARVDVSGASGDASAAEAARRVLNALRERLS